MGCIDQRLQTPLVQEDLQMKTILALLLFMFAAFQAAIGATILWLPGSNDHLDLRFLAQTCLITFFIMLVSAAYLLAFDKRKD